MFGATVSTPLPLLLEVPLRLRLGLRLVPRCRYCLEFRALRLGSLLGLGLPVTAKARSRAMDRSTARATARFYLGASREMNLRQPSLCKLNVSSYSTFKSTDYIIRHLFHCKD